MHTIRTYRSRFTKPVFLLAILALATQLAVEWLFKHRELRSPLRPFLAFLPALIWIFFIVAFVQVVRKMDELQQRITVKAASTAFVLTVILTLIFAGLERAGIYHATWSDVGSPSMFLWAIAYIFLVWRYR